VKAKIGIGKPFFVRFYANYDQTHPEVPIKYDPDIFGPDKELTKEQYCLKTIYRICEFI